MRGSTVRTRRGSWAMTRWTTAGRRCATATPRSSTCPTSRGAEPRGPAPGPLSPVRPALLDVEGHLHLLPHVDLLGALDRDLDRHQIAALAREQRGGEVGVPDPGADRDAAPAVGGAVRDRADRVGLLLGHPRED